MNKQYIIIVFVKKKKRDHCVIAFTGEKSQNSP